MTGKPTLAGLLLAVLTFLPAFAAPEGFSHIHDGTEPLKLQGETIEVPYAVWIRPRLEEAQEDAVPFDVWTDVDLSPVQERAPALMARSNSHRECGERVRVSRVSLAPRSPRAELCASVNYQNWNCIYALLPHVDGLKITMRKTVTAKTKLVDQTARMCADLWPEVDEDGESVSLEGNVTQNTVSGNSGLLGQLVDVRGQFRAQLRSDVNAALSTFRLLLPEVLQNFDPQVESAEFTERDNGALGLVLTMSVNVTREDAPAIMELVTGSE